MKFLWSGNPFKKNREEEAVSVALKKCYLFENFSVTEYLQLKDKLHVRKYNVGENVFEQHHPGTGVYVLVSGKVAIEENSFFIDTKTDEEAKRSIIVENLEPGDFFGELALVDDDHIRPATAKIIEPSLIIGFFKPDFMELLNQHPDTGAKLSLRIAKVTSERLKDAVEEIKKARS